LSDIFPIQNGLKQGDDPSPLLFNFALEYAIARFEQTRRRTKEFADGVNLLAESIYRVRQRIGLFLSVKKIISIGYHDTVTFIRKYIL